MKLGTFAIVLFSFLSSTVMSDDNEPLLWCTGGGGWRAMVASMGYANAFASAGLITREENKIDTMSSSSGGSWFMLQLFYSQNFYNKVVESSPDNLEKFVSDWMDAYAKVPLTGLETCPLYQPVSSILEEIGFDMGVVNFIGSILCLLETDFSWADFIERMLDSVSKDYGEKGFTDVLANEENKIAPLTGVGLHVQTALAPSAFSNKGTDIFWGPRGSNEKDVFSTVTPLQWVTKQEDNKWVADNVVTGTSYCGIRMPDRLTNFHDGMLPLDSYREFPNDVNAWPFQRLVQLKDQDEGEIVDFELPFGGSPNVAQIAAASSAAVGFITARSPVTFVQFVLKLRKHVQSYLVISTMRAVFTALWNSVIEIGDASVCTQWEAGFSSCPEDAGYLFDGGYADNLAVAQTIGRRQQEVHGKPIKVIVTRHYGKKKWGEDFLMWDDFLNYFQHSRNDCIKPGQLMWTADGEVRNGTLDTMIPMPSPQIFKERLSLEGITAAAEDVGDINVQDTKFTTTVFHATTVDNPAFGVKAGHSVSILLIDSTSLLPTIVVGPSKIKSETPGFAELAKSISSSHVLQERIKDFLDTSVDSIDKGSVYLPQPAPSNCDNPNILSQNTESCITRSCASGLSCIVSLMGPVCTDGGIGSFCFSNSNCNNGRCLFSICTAKSDVGGPCDENSDCTSGNCVKILDAGVTVGYCSDGGIGSICLWDSDCKSNHCLVSICTAKSEVGGPCDENSDCTSGTCVIPFCTDRSDGSRCDTNSHCNSGNCVKILDAGVTVGYCSDGGIGSFCSWDSDCNSGRCSFGKCKAKEGLGEFCAEDSDCLNGNCAVGKCRNGKNWSLCLGDFDCMSGYDCVTTTGGRVCSSGYNGSPCGYWKHCHSGYCPVTRCRSKPWWL